MNVWPEERQRFADVFLTREQQEAMRLLDQLGLAWFAERGGPEVAAELVAWRRSRLAELTPEELQRVRDQTRTPKELQQSWEVCQ